MTLYRGITGIDIEEQEKILQSQKSSKAFLSTSSVLDVALAHTDFMPGKMDFNYHNKHVILEMHLAPGIKYIDYNDVVKDDLGNRWQHEFILQPGLKFEIKGRKDITITKDITKNPSTSKGKEKKKDEESQPVETETRIFDILVVEVSLAASTTGGKRGKNYKVK